MSSIDNRRKQFKKVFDENDCRRRREDNRLQIRKSKKEEQLMKRRSNNQSQVTNLQPTTPGIVSDNISNQNDSYIYTKTDIPKLMEILCNPIQDDDAVLTAVKGFRKMLSVEQDPPVDEVLAAGALPYFVEYLKRSIDNPMLTFESAWALTNIASTTRTKEVVDSGAVPHLVDLLRHQRPELREQAAWCLGNIAGDCFELRDYVLHCGAMDGLIMNLQNPETMSLLSNVTWTISNLCRGKPVPALDLVMPVIQPLTSLFYREVSREVVVDAVWALSYLADGEDERIQKVMDTNVTSKLIEFLGNEASPSLTTPTVRCLGNFVTGNDFQTQEVIDCGILKHTLSLLDHPSKNIRKETCWLLSNIGAGTVQQIDKLFHEPNLLRKVVEMAHDSRWEIRREAIWVISNIFTTASDHQVRALVQLEGLRAICEALAVKDSKVITVALEAVEKVLSVGEKENLGYVNLLEEYQGIDKIEELQEHPNDEIYTKSVDLLERFFGVEEEECENLAPEALDDGRTFGFGIPSKQLFPENDGQSTPLTFSFGGSSGNNF